MPSGTSPKTFLAFDLGAESGRAILARLRGGTLEIEEIRRFLNEPVPYLGSLHWDVARLWLEMRKTLTALQCRLDGIGVDTWESITPCSRAKVNCSRIHITIAIHVLKASTIWYSISFQKGKYTRSPVFSLCPSIPCISLWPQADRRRESLKRRPECS